MNAQLEALQKERDYLHGLAYKAIDPHLPFTVSLDGEEVPTSVAERARWNIRTHITMRLREIDQAISELKKELNV